MYDEIALYVKNEIAKSRRFSQPFRNRFEHTKRVSVWARRLHRFEGGDLEVIEIASLFHDVGWDDTIPHEQVSAAVAKNYLTKQGFPKGIVEKVVDAVANHNQRHLPAEQLSIETRIMMDADILDELGAMTIVWDSMATALETDPSYVKAYERTCRYLERNKARQSLLKTESGRAFYAERLRFIEVFLDNLRFELGLCFSAEFDFGRDRTTSLS